MAKVKSSTKTKKDASVPHGKREAKSSDSAAMDPIKIHDAVEVQAYYNFLNRQEKNIPGNEILDWLEAERSVRLRMQ